MAFFHATRDHEGPAQGKGSGLDRARLAFRRERGSGSPAAASVPPDPESFGHHRDFLGDGIAIHGTFEPQLVLDPDPERRRISHGCIRLTNESARELYYLVAVGTPVLIY